MADYDGGGAKRYGGGRLDNTGGGGGGKGVGGLDSVIRMLMDAPLSTRMHDVTAVRRMSVRWRELPSRV
eukprot:2583322-Pleurochrysis_carterae.AAC.4